MVRHRPARRKRQVAPGVENTTKVTTPKSWAVNGVARAGAHVISLDTSGRSAYGGTPADFAVVQAILEIKARGLRVTFYPFLLMDIPAGNTLPDPYSDIAGPSDKAPIPGEGGSLVHQRRTMRGWWTKPPAQVPSGPPRIRIGRRGLYRRSLVEKWLVAMEMGGERG